MFDCISIDNLTMSGLVSEDLFGDYFEESFRLSGGAYRKQRFIDIEDIPDSVRSQMYGVHEVSVEEVAEAIFEQGYGIAPIEAEKDTSESETTVVPDIASQHEDYENFDNLPKFVPWSPRDRTTQDIVFGKLMRRPGSGGHYKNYSWRGRTKRYQQRGGKAERHKLVLAYIESLNKE